MESSEDEADIPSEINYINPNFDQFLRLSEITTNKSSSNQINNKTFNQINNDFNQRSTDLLK